MPGTLGTRKRPIGLAFFEARETRARSILIWARWHFFDTVSRILPVRKIIAPHLVPATLRADKKTFLLLCHCTLMSLNACRRVHVPYAFESCISVLISAHSCPSRYFSLQVSKIYMGLFTVKSLPTGFKKLLLAVYLHLTAAY